MKRTLFSTFVITSCCLGIEAGVTHVPNLLDDPSFTSNPMPGMPLKSDGTKEAYRYDDTGGEKVQIQTDSSVSTTNDFSSFTAPINIFDDALVVDDPEYTPATTTLDDIIPAFNVADFALNGVAGLFDQSQVFNGWYTITLETSNGTFIATSETANLFLGASSGTEMETHIIEQWNQISWNIDPFSDNGIPYRDILSIEIEFFHKTVVPNRTDTAAWFIMDSATIGYNVSIPDTIPPAAPIGLVAMKGNNEAFLDWKTNWDEDIATYNIYRSSTAGGPYSLMASNVITSAYTDSSATNGAIYYYVVRALDHSGNKSSNSNESSADNTSPHDLTGAPNIVVIFADDHGYADVGYHANGSSDVITPHIDSIAENGIQFSAGYVSCNICGPSRAGLMTGNYQNRFGFEDNPSFYQASADVETGIPSSEFTVAELLRSLGYTTGMVGKWHTGRKLSEEPNANGFDEFFGFNNGAANYVPHTSHGYKINKDTNPIQRNGMRVEGVYQYLTDEFGDQAAQFIDRHADEPFFLYVAFNAIHGPMQTTDQYYDMPIFDGISDHDRRVMVSMLYAMDLNIGKILDALDRHTLTENTLVVFLSDNGGKPSTDQKSLNIPLRGEKTEMWDGGIRVPFCLQWPDRLDAGQTIHFPVISLDILPTAIAAAGGTLQHTVDGKNLLPYLLGQTAGEPHDKLYWRRGSNWAVRNSDWKLVRQGSGPYLFNIANDISETNDLYNVETAIRDELQTAYDNWQAQMIDPLWGGGQPYTNLYASDYSFAAHPDSIESWLQANTWLRNAELDLNADPDGDGFENLYEYASGTSPEFPESHPTVVLTFESESPQIQFTQLTGNDTTPFPLTYSVDFRTNLSSGIWESTVLNPDGEGVTNYNERAVHQVYTPETGTGDESGFYRLRITTP